MKPIILNTIEAIRNTVRSVHASGRSIGFVPTMGALHEGHLALVRAAERESEFVIVSIFVNPTQFGPNEDFTRYPRDLANDRERLTETSCEVIFAPSVEEMYPDSLTHVEVSRLGNHLCGPRRPGHFRGVCTVVLKLLNIVQPDVAVFGAKDAQQARIVSRMVCDLDVPTRIVIEPTIREHDGLAMSSRNRYLSETDRREAPMIFQALKTILQQVQQGERDVRTLELNLRAFLLTIPDLRIDYASIVDDKTLEPIETVNRPALAAVAVYLGSTRLIDNIELA